MVHQGLYGGKAIVINGLGFCVFIPILIANNRLEYLQKLLAEYEDTKDIGK